MVIGHSHLKLVKYKEGQAKWNCMQPTPQNVNHILQNTAKNKRKTHHIIGIYNGCGTFLVCNKL